MTFPVSWDTRQDCRGFPLFFIVLCLVTLAVSPGWSRNIHVERLSIESGLSHPTVYAVVQDARGLLWFGSPNGVNIYDGYRFMPFQEDVMTAMDEAERNTSELFIDNQGRVWVGTWGAGLLLYEPATGHLRTFRHIPGDPTSLSHDRIQIIFQDRQDRVWIGTNGGGLNLYEEENGSFRHWSARNSGLLNNRIWSIVQNSDESLWLGTSLGLHRFDPESESFHAYRGGESGHGLSHDEVRCMAVGHDGTLWIGTRKGLNLFDPQNGRFQSYFFDSSQPEQLVSDFINNIYLDKENRLWIGTITGVTVWSLENSNNPRPLFNTLEDVDVRGILADPSGVVWIGSRNTGVYKLRFLKFDHHNQARGTALPDDYVTAFAMDFDGEHMWIGSTGGLARWNRRTGDTESFEHDPAKPGTLGHRDVFAVHVDRTETPWIGLASYGLDRFDSETGTFQHFRHNPEDKTSISSDQVRVIFEDSRMNLWVGTNRGLNLLDRETMTFRHYRHDSNRPETLSHDQVRAIYEDRAGRLWIGTVQGLNRMQDSVEGFRRYQRDPDSTNSLSNNRVRALYESPDLPGVLWIGTGRGGLNRFDVVTEHFVRYRERDGLPNNTVYGIVGDGQGQLWLSTFGGLCQFDPETETFVRYRVSDGLQDIQFNRGAYFSAPDGQLFFGGMNGFNAFYPGKIVPNPHPPPVIISAMTRGNETEYLPDLVDKTIRVTSGSADLGLEFAALDYLHSADNTYAYRLNESDDWIQLGTRRFITLSELAPGSHRLEVRAANNDGVPSVKPLSLKITVEPPLWRKPLAYVLYVLAVLGLGLLFHFARIKRSEHRREKLERLVEARTKELSEKNTAILQRQNQLVMQEKMASLGMLTAGIAHEIRNPLNFVNNFALASADLCGELKDELRAELKEKMLPIDIEQLLDDLANNLNIINKHGRKANAIVQSMMALAHAESVQPEQLNLNELVEKYADVTFSGERARNGIANIQFVKELAPDLSAVHAVPQSLSRVLINILKNAMDALRERATTERHGEDAYQPRLILQTREAESNVELSVWDNGTGIPSENLDKIFNPFFTTKPTGGGNVGLGLSISYEIIARQHAGELNIETEPGRFTKAIIRLPKAAEMT